MNAPICPAFGLCCDCECATPVTIHGECSVCGSFSVVRPGSIGAQIVKRERRPELVFWRGRRFAPLSRVSPADIGDGTRRRRRA